MKEITKYKCDYCKKSYVSKYACREHESICFYNKINKACGSCTNLICCRKNEFGCRKDIMVSCPKDCPEWTQNKFCLECDKEFKPERDRQSYCLECFDPDDITSDDVECVICGETAYKYSEGFCEQCEDFM